MTPDELTGLAARIYADLAPFAIYDAQQGYALATYVSALSSLQQICENYGRSQPDGKGGFAPGYSQLLDITRCPPEVLPWLGQFVGAVVDQSLTDAEQRQQITFVNAWRRGTPSSIVNTAALTLTGAKSVLMRERDAAACPSIPAYGLTIITRTSETPDPVLTEALLRSETVKPAGIILNYETLAGQDFQKLLDDSGNFATVYSTYATMEDILEDTA